MTENKENAEETAAEETQEETAEESEESTEEKSEEETTEETGGEDIDYKAALESLQQTVASDSYKYRNDKRENTEETVDEDDKPITGKLLDEVLKKNTAQTVAILKKEQIETQVRSKARNEDEANLVLHHLETTLSGGTGNISEDLGNAFALANKGRIKEVVSEVNRAIDSSKRKSKGDVQSQKVVKTEDKKPTLSDKDQAMVKHYNLVWDPKEKEHVSPADAKKRGLIK